MKVVLFYHSLISDWNHGNAHFLRGVVTELQRRGHDVQVCEPQDAWSVQNLIQHEGEQAIVAFEQRFPHLRSSRYHLETLDLDRILADADLVIVHEWNERALIHKLGEHRRRNHHYRLLFHDTHHRSISDSDTIASYRLEEYDGVLAFGRVVRERYLDQGWAQRAWVWHEAADVSVFHPQLLASTQGDLVWIGNWGDEERSQRLREFLINPVRRLGLKARVHGVRYPPHALELLKEAGIQYRGWLPNYEAPQVFNSFRVTVHVPRAPYVEMLPGVPTIRVFEALACGIPLICSPWQDVEGLFTPECDYLVARNGAEMGDLLRTLLNEPDTAQMLAYNGLQTILQRHTCGHRVEELLLICRNDLGITTGDAPPAAAFRQSSNGQSSNGQSSNGARVLWQNQPSSSHRKVTESEHNR
ncbi:MAG: glycosyltransferase [Caldilineaceae bacterium]|jgi:spore maturation protein CgeB|nr:glycosyltransferase [Caldilineaceae bacterium]